MSAAQGGRLLACILAAAVLSPHAASAAQRGLCAPDETSVFNCRNGLKTASLGVSGGSTHLRYVFGTPGRIALSYPAATVRPQDAFRHGHIMYSGVGGDYLQFDNGGFRYFVFYILGHDTDNRGVVVERGGKSVMNFVCKGASSDDLTPTSSSPWRCRRSTTTRTSTCRRCFSVRRVNRHHLS